MEQIKVKIIIFFACLTILSGVSAQKMTSVTPIAGQLNLLFNEGWKFYKGGYQAAYSPDLGDSAWREINLPHDWSIEDLPGTSSPFDPSAVGQTSTGFTKGGTGWYRKTFIIDEAAKNKKIHIQFDGVYMNAEVWLNGKKLGENPYGYTSFWFDISKEVNVGKKNVLAVKVKNEGENTRWYSGSGIYRHVWLKFMEPVHVSHWGTSITTSEVSERSANVHLEYTVQNENSASAEVSVQTVILDTSGREVAKTESKQTIEGSGSVVFKHDLLVNSPTLWSVDHPYLYTSRTTVSTGNEVSDREDTPFGIRFISFNTETGFQLNGKPLELKGGCVHHDNGPLGAKAYDRAEERRVELLKAAGYNAIRSAHNPPSQAFLDACDKLGMLVIDEAFDMWRIGKNPFDYHLYFDKWWKKDIESMVLRDRNHPSIIMWSIGNEIPAMDDPETAGVAKMLADHVRKLDSTRPVTAAVNNLNPAKDNFFAALDIAGYNYAVRGDHGKEDIYQEDHERVPGRIMYCSESYPLESFESWMAAKDKSWVIGDFVWTAFDYIGEASIGYLGYWQEKKYYPWTLAYCGDIDVCGWKRPQSYYRDAFWGDTPALSLFVKNPEPSFEENTARASWSKWHFQDVWAAWNWTGYENQPLEVQVYSSCDKVELFLNGKSLGSKSTNRDTEFMAVWNVPYQPGTLKAVGYKGKKKLLESELVTAKRANEIRLSPDRAEIKADGRDLSYITVELVDGNGALDPEADDLVRFEIEGPGAIVGVGNADPVSDESYIQPQRKAWKGKCLVIVKSGKESGTITLKATSENLKSSTITIQTK